MIRFTLTAFACSAALVLGCTAPTGADTDVATADYSSFTLLASDTFDCQISDGQTTTTATLKRSVSQRKVSPQDRLLVQGLHVGEGVHSAGLRAFGSYGCFHAPNSGDDYSARQENYGPTTLPSAVAFTYDAGLQWGNCDYVGTEAATVETTQAGIAITVGLKDGNRSIAFSGDCTKE